MEIFKDKSTSGYLFGGTPYIKSKDVNGNIIYIDPMTGKTVRTEERNGTTYQASAKIKKDQRIREDVRKKHNLRINSGQSIMVGGREVRIGSPKLHYISLSTDNRPLSMKDASKLSYELDYKLLQLDKAVNLTTTALGNFSSYLFPSTYAGALVDKLEGRNSFSGSLIEGNNGLGSVGTNLVFDLASPLVLGKGFSLMTTLGKEAKPILNKVSNIAKPYRISKAIDKGVKENAVITAYNRNPATKDIGNLWDYQSYLDNVFPKSKVKDVLWHGSDVDVAGFRRFMSKPQITAENTAKAELSVKIPNKNSLKGFNFNDLPQEKYVYNDKTGEFDIIAPKKEWIKKGENDLVPDYFVSPLEKERLIATGISPEEALDIMDVRWINSIEALPGKLRHLEKNTFGDTQNINGRAFVRYNSRKGVKASLNDASTTLNIVFHELGGHGSSLNIGYGTQTIPINKKDILMKIYKHNESLRPLLKPFYQAIKDGNFDLAKNLAKDEGIELSSLKGSSGDIDFKSLKNFIEYMEENQEYSARAIGSNMSNHYGMPNGWNEEQLRDIFTKESVDNLLKNVWNYGIPITVGGTSAYSLYNMLQNNNNQINLKRKGGKLHKYQWGNKILNYINNGFDKLRELYNLKLNSSPVNINNLVKYKDEYDNIFMDLKLLKAVDNYMIKKNVGLPQRQAILYTIWLEGSKIGPHGNGASGLVGWRGLRAKGLPNTIEGQAEKLYNEAFGSFNSNNWNHGGNGSGYKSGKEALQAFLNAKTYSDAVRALNYGYVRPPLASIQKRTSTKNMFKKGGKLLKLQYGSPIYYDYSIGNNSGYVDNEGYLHNPNTGDYGSVMLPEVVVTGKYFPKNYRNFYNLLSNTSENNYVDLNKFFTNYIENDKKRKKYLSGEELGIIELSKLNPLNPSPYNSNNNLESAHYKALEDLYNYYNSKEYKNRLKNIPNNLFSYYSNRYKELGKPRIIRDENGNYYAHTIREGDNKGIEYNEFVIDNDPYGTATHEISHWFDYKLPLNIINYNNNLIKLNPYASLKEKEYYGDPTEIRARGMHILMHYLNNKDRYNSLEEFVNKNNKLSPVKELKYIFKDNQSLLDYLNNFVQNDTNPIDKFKNWYGKQGGKMDTLQFLKNGSGIHIKKENKGLFTDYCGGKVTSECISKGKHSSNPAIRKRATFAANARKWKHKYGGFVNGVSVLDSNPDAYKYVKKKIKKAADGSLLTIGLKIGNAINSPLGKLGIDVGLKLIGGILDVTNRIKYNEYLLNWKKNYVNSQSLSDAERQNFYIQSVLNQQMNNPDGNVSDIVTSHDAWKLEQLELQKRKKAAETLADLYITQMSLIDNNNLTDGFNFAGMASDILSGVLGNSGNSSKTQAITNPSSTYSLFKMPPIDFKVDMKNMKL